MNNNIDNSMAFNRPQPFEIKKLDEYRTILERVDHLATCFMGKIVRWIKNFNFPGAEKINDAFMKFLEKRNEIIEVTNEFIHLKGRITEINDDAFNYDAFNEEYGELADKHHTLIHGNNRDNLEFIGLLLSLVRNRLDKEKNDLFSSLDKEKNDLFSKRTVFQNTKELMNSIYYSFTSPEVTETIEIDDGIKITTQMYNDVFLRGHFYINEKETKLNKETIQSLEEKLGHQGFLNIGGFLNQSNLFDFVIHLTKIANIYYGESTTAKNVAQQDMDYHVQFNDTSDKVKMKVIVRLQAHPLNLNEEYMPGRSKHNEVIYCIAQRELTISKKDLQTDWIKEVGKCLDPNNMPQIPFTSNVVVEDSYTGLFNSLEEATAQFNAFQQAQCA